MAETLTERICRRIKAEMTRRHLSQRDLAGLLETDQPRISRILNGQQTMTVEDLAALCFAVSLYPTEAVRDHGLEFCAEMTPTELRVLEQYRAAPDAVKDALNTLLGVRVRPLGKPQRHAAPLPDKKFTQR